MTQNSSQPVQDRILWRTVSPVCAYMAVFALSLVFITDLFTRLGFMHGALYVVPILLASMSGQFRWVLAIAASAAILNVLGLYLSPPAPDGVPMQYAIANRAVALFLIVAVTLISRALLQLYWRANERSRLVDEARRTLDRNQRLLQMASTVGRFGGWSVELSPLRLYWSDQIREIYGVPAEYTPDLDAAIDYYAPEDRDRIRSLFEACANRGESFDADLQLITGAGKRIWVRAVGQAVRDDDGRIVTVEGALQDISAPKALEFSLSQSQTRFRQLANAMPLIVWTAEPDGKPDYCSYALMDYSGLRDKDLRAQRHWLKLLHPDDREPFLRGWRDSVVNSQAFTMEARIRRRDGSYRWHLIQARPSFDMRGQLLKWYGSALQIHDRVLLEQETKALSARLINTLESMSDAFFLLDSNWRFTYLNTVAERVLQRTRAELLGMSVWDAFPEAEDSEFFLQYTRAMRESRSVHFQSYYEPLESWFEVNAYPSPDGLAVYFQNINERLRLEEQLRESQRLESLGQLTGGVAHDFNNLLTVIMGNSEFLAEQLSGQPRLRQIAQLVGNAAQRGAELTQRLLAFARRQALEPKAVDINQLLHGMASLLSRTLGERYTLRIRAGTDLWPAMIDPGQLENAVLNLCLNARDAMPEGGVLALETSNTVLDQQYTANHPDVAPGEYVMLSVSDTGHGIASAHMHRVFEPFFTTKDKDKGTGLGLSMVYGFIKQSQGHISIYSEPELGTSVRMYLPRATGAALPAADPEGAPDASATNSNAETILLVEDDDLVRQNTLMQLHSLGYQVLSASNGMQALEIIRGDAHIDLLFTDVVMPGGINGRELAEAALTVRPGLKVLFTSGYTHDVIVHQGRLDVGLQLLCKPYRRNELACKLREVLYDTDNHANNTVTNNG